MKVTAIVLSAGSGRRMGGDIPKQYMDLCGYPVLYYALRAFDESRVDDIVLVVSEDYVGYVTENIVAAYSFAKPVKVVVGGSERADSVRNGLAATDAGYVLIHDGARPLIETSIINAMIDDVMREQACVAAVPVKDTLKYSENKTYVDHTVDRNHIMAMQTPQAFNRQLLVTAYETMEQQSEGGAFLTDDAMLIELYTDARVYLSVGSYRNIKVTTPEDLVIAKAFLEAKK